MYSQNCQIIITNDRICKFYKEHLQLDIETVNLYIIDLLDTFLKKMNISENFEKNNSGGEFIYGFSNVFVEPFPLRTDETIQTLSDSKEKYSSYSDTEKSDASLIISKNINFHMSNDNECEKYSNNSTCYEEKINSIINLLKKEVFNDQKCDNKNISILKLLNKIYTTGDVSIVSYPSMMFSRTLFKVIPENHSLPKEITSENKKYEDDLYVIKRPNKYNILVENKTIERNVNNEEIRDFIQLMEENNCHGILLSQNSGISLKNDFHIEIYNKLIIVYVHNVNFNEQKIKMAVDIIDNLAIKVRELHRQEDIHEIIIDKEILEEINKEYQIFIQQKETLINIFKENQKHFFLQIEELKFPELGKYLSTKFSIPVIKQGFKCDLCKRFNGNNLKALAAHKRGCLRKINNKNVIK
jgi:hypothetical protein